VCTLVFAWQVFADAPLVAAANRDESYERSFHPPTVIETDPQVVAPLDEQAGGTWIGYNEHGVFAAITNRWVDADLAGERSRGLLVRDVLGYETAEDATRYVERQLEAAEYAGFNLVIADAAAALYVEWDGSAGVRNLDPGVHVVANVGADGQYTIPAFRQAIAEQQATNADRLRTDLQPEPGEGSATWLDRAATAIADHEYGVCVHEDGFGTTSSSLITIGPEGGTYRFADGPPCETAYERPTRE
jgi:uncharacterized protein with NRDE domain